MRSILPLLLLALAGCAGMSKKECLNADWRAIGYEDGARGAPVLAMSSRRKACVEKAGVAPDMDAYLSGRGEGLSAYCTPSSGFAVGARGETYHGVCEGGAGERFLSRYQAGRTLFELQTNAAAVERALSETQTALWDVKRRIRYVEAAVVSPETPHPERVDYLLELKSLTEERRRLERAVAERERDLAHAQDALADYRAYLAEAPQDRVVAPTAASY